MGLGEGWEFTRKCHLIPGQPFSPQKRGAILKFRKTVITHYLEIFRSGTWWCQNLQLVRTMHYFTEALTAGRSLPALLSLQSAGSTTSCPHTHPPRIWVTSGQILLQKPSNSCKSIIYLFVLRQVRQHVQVLTYVKKTTHIPFFRGIQYINISFVSVQKRPVTISLLTRRALF